MTYADALDRALIEEMERDERVFFMATNPTPALARAFDGRRVRRTPISEASFTGVALGAAAAGYRPVVWWRNATFSFVAFDQVANQAAKIRYMFGGQRDFPVVFRATSGGGSRMAAQHSQSPYALFAHTPGIKVIVPSTPADALGLLKTAIRDNNPVVTFEPARLDPIVGDVPFEGDDALVPFGTAAIRRTGADVTIVALGYMVGIALQAAEDLAALGIEATVIDPRTIVPLDVETIRASVRETGRLVVVDEAPAMCSFTSEVVALTAEDPDTFRALRAPAARVTSLPVPVPYSPPMEDFVLPSKDRIVRAVHGAMEGVRA